MGTIAEVRNVMSIFTREFPEEISQTLKENEDLIKDIIQDQLMAGVDENMNALYPTYLSDPYFKESTKTEEAAKKKAAQWRNWKARLFPPTTTDLLHLPPRHVDSPNLIIKGNYYDSITPVVQGDKIVTKSVGFYAGEDIEKKYGPHHLGISKEGRIYLIYEKIYPAISKLLKKYRFK